MTISHNITKQISSFNDKCKPQFDNKLTLVYNSKKKLKIRNMGCKKCELLDWSFL